MPQSPDVLIVGGGAIGASCARALAVAGAKVLLLESALGSAGAAWVASAGMLAAQVEAQPDDLLLPLALAGRKWFAGQSAQFRETIGSIECGIVEVAYDSSEVAALETRVAWQKQRQLNADWLGAAEVARRWPWFAPSRGAFWWPDDGAVDPRRLVAALRADAVAHGAQLVSDTAIGLDHDGTQMHGVLGEHGRYHAETVVIAAGAWSATLTRMPRKLPVEPVRGQMIAFPWPADMETAVVYGNGCYMLRRGDELLVGATVEDVGFDTSVTVDGVADLHARASRVYPALSAMQPLRAWAGLRPATPDGRPIIGEESRLRGLWYATGHGRNGILLSGITGELIARGVRGESIAADVSGSGTARLGD